MIPLYPESTNDEGNDATKPSGMVARFDIYSHHIKITEFNRDVKIILLGYCKKVSQQGLMKIGNAWGMGTVKVFVGVTRDRSEFNFHINQLESILKYLSNQGISEKSINVVEHKLYVPLKLGLKYNDTRKPRDYQVPIIEYITNPGISKLVTLKPGEGKTFIALAVMRDINERVFFCIKPMYIKKWISDVQEAFKTKPGDIMTISGSSQLMSLTNLAYSGELRAKVILCSNATFYQYLKNYEIMGEDITSVGYACTPHNFYELLKVGLKVVDESHQDFHLNFRQDLYTHVPKTLSLSGTMVSDDRFITKMYEVMFPAIDRYHSKGSGDIYMSMEALMYGFPNADKRIRYYNRHIRAYSHNYFEQSIIRRPKLLTKYLDMICDIVKNRFVTHYEKGQKMVIYCYTVDMCTLVSSKLQQLHPRIDVYRYTQEDDYHTMLNSEIIVSTLKSLGTAVDLDGLRTVLMTDAISSKQANLQAAGRLRKLKDWPDTTPEFLYLVARDIDTHIRYHEKKLEIFSGLVTRQLVTPTNYYI